MTEEELKQYMDLNDKFINRCNEIAKIMNRCNYSYNYIDDWRLDGDDVYGTGDEYWNYGGHESHTVWFDVAWLTKTDEELNKIADEWLDKQRREKEKKLKEDEAKKREQELAELKRLQEKYKV